MSLLKERKTISQNIAFMAIMAAINIIVCVVGGFSVLASVILILILPLSSTLVEVYCKTKYFPIYFVATIGLSIAATFWNLETTIFTLIPSMITGFVFGLSLKKKINGIYGIFVATLLNVGLIYCFIPLVDFLFETDIIWFFCSALNISDESAILNYLPSLFFVYSLIQTFLSYLVVINEIKKFNLDDQFDVKNEVLLSSVTLGFSIMTLAFYFVNAAVAFFFFCCSLYFAYFVVVHFAKQKDKNVLIPSGIAFIVSIFMFAAFNNKLKDGTSALIFVFVPFCISLISFIVSLLKKKQNKIK